MTHSLLNLKILPVAALGFALLVSDTSIGSQQTGYSKGIHSTPDTVDGAHESSGLALTRPGEDAPQEFPGNLTDTGIQVLAQAIVYLRDIVIENSKPMPEKIKRKLTPYFDRHILQKVRYTTDWSPAISAALRRFMDTGRYSLALTLDNVIVFSDEESLDNLWLWVHELKHVEQYDRWGIRTFAGNYLENYQSIENEANEYAAQVLRELRSLPRKPTAQGSMD